MIWEDVNEYCPPSLCVLRFGKNPFTNKNSQTTVLLCPPFSVVELSVIFVLSSWQEHARSSTDQHVRLPRKINGVALAIWWSSSCVPWPSTAAAASDSLAVVVRAVYDMHMPHQET
jgi:hypothetical protein